jgi:hypothetical protein
VPVPPFKNATASVLSAEDKLYTTCHEAAVVPVIRMQYNVADTPAVTDVTALPPLELTVTVPVELLTMINLCPNLRVVTTGRTTV